MPSPELTIPLRVLVDAEEVMRQIKQLPVNTPVPPKMWLTLCHASAAMTFYKDNALAHQRLGVTA